jgi:hypothetical protein
MNSALTAKNFALVAGMTILLTLPFSNIVVADSGFRAYNYYAGGGFLCTLNASFCPDIAMATSNGDTVTISGSGTLTIHPDSVTGTGTFIHKDSAGNVKASGTWTATQLMSFVSYGSGSLQGFPSNFEGGKAVIRVHASVGVDAILTVYCLLGSPPAGQEEGIKLNVQDIINFNMQAGGNTLFIRTA